MTLLARARAAGLAAWIKGGRLALEGPEDLEPLALELLAAEGVVLAELEAERARRETEAPFALLPAGADPERPPWGWAFVRSGPLAGCWIGPGCALDSPMTIARIGTRRQSIAMMFSAIAAAWPPATCRVCRRSGSWWRLRALTTGAPGAWVCERCHPPGPPETAIERAEAAA